VETVAVNPTLVALAGTVTDGCTVTAELVLARLTLIPPEGAAALRVTVQASVPEPDIDELAHEMPLRVGVAAAVPVPLRLTATVEFVEELLVMVNCPVAEPAAEGSNCTFTDAD
jgi:hypothetical protein